jgi:hypothetical protein
MTFFPFAELEQSEAGISSMIPSRRSIRSELSRGKGPVQRED